MRVLQINAVYGVGSTGTIVKDIQRECETNGIECFVAYASCDGNAVHNGYKIGNVFSNKLHALLCRIAGKQAYFSILPTLFFLKYIKELKPDIVHLHNLHSNFIHLNLLLKYLAKNNIRTIITLHDCWFYTGGCFHYTAIGCNKWITGCHHCPKQYADTPAYVCDASKRIWKDRKQYLDAIKDLEIVGVSKWLSNEASKGLLKNRSITTIYNGIDRDIFKHTPSDLRRVLGLEDKYVLLGPASKWLSPVNKDVLGYFISNMTSYMSLVLFGVVSKSEDLPDNVIEYGFTKDKKELAALYSMADVFVNCSREDTLSLINLEAQSCGTPVVSFAKTGIGETVDTQSGCLVDNWSAKELFHCVLDIKNKDSKSIPILNDCFSNDYSLRYLSLYLRNVTS